MNFFQDMSHNKLQSLPPSVGYLTRVIQFKIANNALKCLPHETGSMRSETCIFSNVIVLYSKTPDERPS